MRLVLPLELARATVELLRARLALTRLPPGAVASSAHFERVSDDQPLQPVVPDIERVAWLIPRVAARLPWRADCLVQALAARRWLSALGHETELHLGTRKEGGGIEAHAWLTCRGEVVTGGRIDPYARLMKPARTSLEP